jgi:hypothetical protein
VRPDVSDKSMCPDDADFLRTGPSDSYQERVLHYGLMGTDEFIYFAPWAGFVYGTRGTMADHVRKSAFLGPFYTRIDLLTKTGSGQT